MVITVISYVGKYYVFHFLVWGKNCFKKSFNGGTLFFAYQFYNMYLKKNKIFLLLDKCIKSEWHFKTT